VTKCEVAKHGGVDDAKDTNDDAGPMLIRLGFDIQFDVPAPVAMVAMFHVHSTRTADLREPDQPRITPSVLLEEYEDSFGNICSRFVAPAGSFQLYHSTLIEDSGLPDPVSALACEVPVERLPHEVLRFLLASRYCEVDRLLDVLHVDRDVVDAGGRQATSAGRLGIGR